MRDSKRLTAIAVSKISEPGRYGDGGGLVLQVSKWHTKAWLFRYERDGRERQMGLGSLATLTLAEARERARDCRKLLLEEVDPIETRRARRLQARLAQARGLTFKRCAELYIAAHLVGWKNKKHADQWPASLATYAYPTVGDLSVATIDTALVTKCLEPIWTQKPETAGRVRGRIESVLDWAKARGYRDGENPARWRGHLDKLLPARSKVRRVKHLAALPYTELPALMAELRARQDISARALEFTILTVARTGEAIGARWPEFDFSKRLWHVPLERMKAARPHDVPLSERALAILKLLPLEKESNFVFIGARAGHPLSNMAMLEALRGLRPGLTVHGFRSTFRDWAAERTNYPNHVVEMALAHAIGDKVEAAYRRGDLIEKRRCLMNDWARYCHQSASRPAKIIAFKR